MQKKPSSTPGKKPTEQERSRERAGRIAERRAVGVRPGRRGGRGSAGTLYIVATPIGNLEDMTIRAIRVLKEVHLIAAEDTRRTRILLDKYQISTPLTSLYDQNESQKSALLLAKLQAGEDVAYVSDAGTPGISDPGYILVREAISRGIRVTPIPGRVGADRRPERLRSADGQFHFFRIPAVESGKTPTVPDLSPR